LEALSDEDGAGVKFLVEDYEKQLRQQKEEFDNLAVSMSRQWGGKIALLTRQYENRIKALNASHQAELQLATENRAFELMQIELDIEEKVQKEYLSAKREKNETIRSLENEMEELKAKFTDAQDENRLIRALVDNFKTLNPELEMTLRLPEGDPEVMKPLNIMPRGQLYNEADDEKLSGMKADLRSLHKWLLNEQKQALQRQIDRFRDGDQRSIRDILMRIQTSLSKCAIEGETTLNLNECVDQLTSAFIKMNEILEQQRPFEDAVIPLAEAEERIREIMDRQPAPQIVTIPERVPDSKPVDIRLYEDEIVDLTERIRFLESLQEGDQQATQRQMQEIENRLILEINARDIIIDDLRHPVPPPPPVVVKGDFRGQFFHDLTFHYEMQDKSESESDDEPEPPPPIPAAEAAEVKVQDIQPEVQVVSVDAATPVYVATPIEVPAVVLPKKKKKQPRCLVTVGSQTDLLTISVPRPIFRPVDEIALAPDENPPKTGAPRPMARRLGIILDNGITINGHPHRLVSSSATVGVTIVAPPTPPKAPLKPPRQKRLFLSRASAHHFPEPIIEPILSVPVAILRTDRVQVYFDIAEIAIVRVVSEPDQEMLAILQDLQNRVAHMELETESDSANQGDLNMQRLFAELRIATIDASHAIIAHQKATIDSILGRMSQLSPRPRLPPPTDLQSVQTDPVHLVFDPLVDTSIPPIVPVIYLRPPPTPVVLDMRDLSEAEREAIDDPFLGAIKMLGRIIQFFANFVDNEAHIATTLDNDTGAYEAFLTATRNTEPSHHTFIQQIQKTVRCLKDNREQLEEMAVFHMRLLRVLNASKRFGRDLMASVRNLQTVGTVRSLQREQDSLAALLAHPKQSLDQILVLEKLLSALEVVDKWEIPLTTEQAAKFAVLMKRIHDTRAQTVRPQTLIEALAASVQGFLESIRPSISDVPLTPNSMVDVAKLAAKLRKLTALLDQRDGELALEKEKCQVLDEQCRALRMRLADEKELSDNAAAVYQTQSQVLTELFKTLTNDSKDSSKSPLGIVADVRNEVLLLQALSETAQNDRNVMKSKIADMENQFLNRDQYELQLKQQIAELRSQNDALRLKFRSLRESALFHDTQLGGLIQEKKADAELAENYRSQLEDALLRIDQLQHELAKSDEDVQVLKNRLHKRLDDQNEVDLKTSFNHLMAGTKEFATAETQTMWTVAVKRPGSEMPRQKSSRQVVKPKVSEKQTVIQLPATPRDSQETIRITRVDYVAPEKPPQGRSFVSPVSRSTLQSDPMFITGPSKSFTGANLDEITHVTHRMRDRIAELEAALSKSDTTVIDLRRKLAAVSRDRQRLNMELARYQAQQKRAEIRCANAQTRLEVAMNELGVREDDNYNLRREVIELKQKMGSPSRSLAHIEHSRTEQDIVKREKRQQKMVIAAAQTALDKTANTAIRSHLERLLENSQKSVARLEAKRRMWQEIERKQVFAALSALSLVHDTQFSRAIESSE
jgi:hypothetical protein